MEVNREEIGGCGNGLDPIQIHCMHVRILKRNLLIFVVVALECHLCLLIVVFKLVLTVLLCALGLMLSSSQTFLLIAIQC